MSDFESRDMSGEAVAERLGLIAGGGDLPLEMARAARGRRVAAVGFRGITDPALEAHVETLEWHALGAVDALLGSVARRGVTSLVLGGKFDPSLVLREPALLDLDERGRALLAGLSDRRERSVLSFVADLLADEGFDVLPQSTLLGHLLPSPGVLGKVEPTAEQWADVRLGWRLARRLADDDVGQCVVIKSRSVAAVEALEGTDAAIHRGVGLAGSGAVVVKRARRGHDPRFDLPTVGPDTIDPVARAGGGVLAVEVGTTLVLHRAELVERADRHGVAIVALDESGAASA